MFEKRKKSFGGGDAGGGLDLGEMPQAPDISAVLSEASAALEREKSEAKARKEAKKQASVIFDRCRC